MSDFTLRRADNSVEAEGYLDSKKLECKTFTFKDKNNQDATIEKVQGEIVVEVDELTKIKFRVDVNRYKADGTQSKVYDKVMAVMNDYVARSDCAAQGKPITEADRVRVKGSFDHRDHPNGEKTEIWSYGVYNFNFIERISELDYKPHTKFKVEMYTESIEDEKVNDVPTGAVFVNGIVPLYNRVIPLRLRFGTTTLDNGETVDLGDYIKQNFSAGKTFAAFGKIIGEVNSTTSKQTIIGAQQTFETVSVKPVVTAITEQYLITDPKHYDKDGIKAALNARQEMLDKLKERLTGDGTPSGVVGSVPTSAPSSTPVTNTERTLNW